MCTILILGALEKLTEACRRFLLSPSKDLTIKRWAVEGLSYLTLDADVKEQLVQVKFSNTSESRLVTCS